MLVSKNTDVQMFVHVSSQCINNVNKILMKY